MLEVARGILQFLKEGGIYAFFAGSLVIIGWLALELRKERTDRLDGIERHRVEIGAEKDAHRQTILTTLVPVLSEVKMVLQEFQLARGRRHGASGQRSRESGGDGDGGRSSGAGQAAVGGSDVSSKGGA